LIAFFLGNISAKNDQNQFIYVTVMASQSSDIFGDIVYMTGPVDVPGAVVVVGIGYGEAALLW